MFFFQAERKKYEKETEKYYSSLEKLLNMSAKKKEPQLQEVSIVPEMQPAKYLSIFMKDWVKAHVASMPCKHMFAHLA